jgi:hypothetical protein
MSNRIAVATLNMSSTHAEDWRKRGDQYDWHQQAVFDCQV